MNSLYTYLPKDNTVMKDGVLGTASVPGAYDKYAGRAKSADIEKIKAWLEMTAPGRSNSVSVLTRPIDERAPKKIQEWRKHRTEVELPSYKELLKAKLVAALYKTRKGRGVDTVEDTEEHEYGEPGQFLFSNTPHYILPLTGKSIPLNNIKRINGVDWKNIKKTADGSLQRHRF